MCQEIGRSLHDFLHSPQTPGCQPLERGTGPVMALRIAVGIYAALRAMLIYGEAAELATRPLCPPRIRRAARWSPRRAVLDRRVLS